MAFWYWFGAVLGSSTHLICLSWDKKAKPKHFTLFLRTLLANWVCLSLLTALWLKCSCGKPWAFGYKMLWFLRCVLSCVWSLTTVGRCYPKAEGLFLHSLSPYCTPKGVLYFLCLSRNCWNCKSVIKNCSVIGTWASGRSRGKSTSSCSTPFCEWFVSLSFMCRSLFWVWFPLALFSVLCWWVDTIYMKRLHYFLFIGIFMLLNVTTLCSDKMK